MQIVIRVDASATIGTGHVMRCLTLADEFKRQGGVVIFITRQLPAYLQQVIEKRGHQVVLIGKKSMNEPCDDLAYAHFLGTSQAQDASQTKEILQELQTAWLIVDHYGIDHRWELVLRPYTQKILVVDDLADRSHICDLLVDQNLYADMDTRYTGRIPSTAEKLLGVKFVILRPEFRQGRQHAKVRRGKPKRLFVFFGGMDSSNYTLPILCAIKSLQIEALEVDVVIGTEHPADDEIQTLCREQGYNCHVQTSEMAQLLIDADLAIGAGGSTSWERCCLGLPTLAYAVAPNQKALTLHADYLGLLRAGCAGIHDKKALCAELRNFIEADTERERMSQVCFDTVHTDGVHKIFWHMQLNKLLIRTASPDDVRRLFEWRNHPSIRSVSTNSDPIDWDAHESWFLQVMQDPNRIIYIAELQQQAVGVIRYDLDEDTAEVSIYLAPEQKGKGLGTQLLLGAENQLLRERPGVRCLRAKVLESNKHSHKLFKRCGYEFAECKYYKFIRA